MNGNDYLEIEEEHIEEITNCYADRIKRGKMPVPKDFVIAWIDRYLEGE